ncbi:MAG: trypsin-like peptidase domain-containing protein [Raoultibacter sp.]
MLAFAGAALACIIALSGFGIYSAVTGGSGSSGSTVLGSTSNTSINATDEDQTLAEAVAQKSLPSVVAIDVYTNQSANMYGFGSGSSSSNSGSLTQSSLGSGVVLSEDGYIITNNHVVEGAAALKVTIEGNQYDAEIVGTDASSDLAVIKAKDASGLTPMEIGSSDDLIIGEWVMTLGSPFGLEQSVATGIVSATSRSQIMESETGGETAIYANMIQTDAAINPGNSGGALVDSDGKLIGINTLITSPSGAFAGVGFAIPVNYAINIAQQIISGETPTHAQLGVSLSTVNEQIAQRYGLSVNEGAYISQVSAGSGAAEAGVQVGDIITKFNGQAITSASDLMLDVRSMSPGDKVTLELNRDGKTETVEVTLGSDGSTQNSSSQQQSGSLQELFGGGTSNNGNNA